MKRITPLVHGALALTAASALALAGCAAGVTGGQTPQETHTATAQEAPDGAPTIVLVHGAWADAAGWTPVIERLQDNGYTVVAPANPLRGLATDSAYLEAVLTQIDGPVLLAGHSYGGAVITNAAAGNSKVEGLVYIAGFAPDEGESLATLNETEEGKEIDPVPALPTTFPKDGGTEGTELTIDVTKYSSVFLNDQLTDQTAQALAVEQRPLSLDSVLEVSGVPAWKSIPSWYLVAAEDRAIAPSLERFMAERAGAHTVEIDAPHLVMATDPDAVAELIETAASAVTR